MTIIVTVLKKNDLIDVLGENKFQLCVYFSFSFTFDFMNTLITKKSR